MSKISIGVIGFGFVGKATAELQAVCPVHVFDPAFTEFSLTEALKNAYTSDLVICCVPTPENNGDIDLSILEKSIDIWVSFNEDNIFVIKSTIPAGTVDRLCKKHGTRRIIHNPEFLTERTHIQDFLNPTDVVIGGDLDSCNKLAEVYKKFYANKNISINICTAKEAELTKVVRNSFYATKVIFMNEIFHLAQKLGIDYGSFEKLLTNYGRHPWWGEKHTQVPGPDGDFGFGGKCFPKDCVGLLALAEAFGVDLSVLGAAVTKNNSIRPQGTIL